MKTIMLSLSMLFCLLANAQDAPKRKIRFPAGLYTEDNADIYGIAVGVGSDNYQNSDYVGTRCYGVRIEPLSQSLLIFTMIFPVDMVSYPRTPDAIPEFAKKLPNEVVYGVNISCGTNAFADVNGITASALVQSLRKTNGLSVTGMYSHSFRNNGLQAAVGGTSSFYSNGILLSLFNARVYEGNGLQVSMVNDFDSFTGVQVGLANGAFGKAEHFTGLQIGLFNNARKLKGFQIGLINKNSKRILPLINWDF